MMQALLPAVGLMLVIEGIMPFLSPGAFRRAMLLAAQLDDGSLRWLGLGSMLLGLAIVYLAN